MWSIRLDDALLFSDQLRDERYALTAASLSWELGKAGTLTVSLYPTNVLYSGFVPFKNVVKLYRNDVLYWSGRTYSVSVDINGCKTVAFEGLLAVLNDAILKPYTTDADGKSIPKEYNDSLAGVLTTMIAEFNEQVGEDRQLTFGSVGSCDTSIVYRQYEQYDTFYNRLNDLADSYSALMSIRTDGSVWYLDFLTEGDYSTVSNQTIDFGVNLLTVTQQQIPSEFCTVLVPLGANVQDDDGSSYPLTVASVNDGKDYIEVDDTELLERYGRIVGTNTWSDVTTPAALLSKSKTYLNTRATPTVSITVTALDMAKAGSSVEAWKLGDMIMVNAPAHGISSEPFLCRSQTLNLLNPSGNSMSLSQTHQGMVEIQKKTDKQINNNYSYLNKTVNKLNQTVSDNLTVTESGIETTADAIRIFCKQWLTDDEYQAHENDITALMEITAGAITTSFNSLWITESDSGITIGRNGSTMQSVQDNDSYDFIDTATNTSVLTLDGDGLTAKTANVSGQLVVLDGSTRQWAIRKGAQRSGVGVNLDIVWIG